MGTLYEIENPQLQNLFFALLSQKYNSELLARHIKSILACNIHDAFSLLLQHNSALFHACV